MALFGILFIGIVKSVVKMVGSIFMKSNRFRDH